MSLFYLNSLNKKKHKSKTNDLFINNLSSSCPENNIIFLPYNSNNDISCWSMPNNYNSYDSNPLSDYMNSYLSSGEESSKSPNSIKSNDNNSIEFIFSDDSKNDDNDENNTMFSFDNEDNDLNPTIFSFDNEDNTETINNFDGDFFNNLDNPQIKSIFENISKNLCENE